MENEYNPSSVSAPGETLKDILEERGITQSQLSNQISCSDEDLTLVLDGKAPITPNLASDLERVLGTPAQFWLARDRRFKEWLTHERLKEVYCG